MKPTWKDLQFWKTPEWKRLKKMFAEDGDFICPDPKVVFRPLIQTKLDKVRVVFILPEPYYIKTLADGLAISFKPNSVFTGVDAPPIIFQNLMEELEADVKVRVKRPDLSKWSKQGILLWNATPTTVNGSHGRHRKLGWEKLTKEILETVYLVNPDAIFVFFGSAQTWIKEMPSDAIKMRMPIVSFEGTKLFSTINKILSEKKHGKINWKV